MWWLGVRRALQDSSKDPSCREGSGVAQVFNCNSFKREKGIKAQRDEGWVGVDREGLAPPPVCRVSQGRAAHRWLLGHSRTTRGSKGGPHIFLLWMGWGAPLWPGPVEGQPGPRRRLVPTHFHSTSSCSLMVPSSVMSTTMT